MAVKTKVGLDSMIFIYHFDHVEPYFTHTKNLFTQAQRGDFEVITSLISVIEVLSPVVYRRSLEIIKEINIYFKEARYLHVVDITWDIAQEAARLRREYKILRTPDAIQLATAIIHNAHTFITNDVKLKRLSLTRLTIQTLS